jgi:hypothetical protein
MLTIYLAALAIGGTLLAASIFLGGHHHGHDADHGHGGDSAEGALLDWLPVASLRFWTFFLAFAGATGAALLLAGAAPGRLGTAALALGVGYASGLAAVVVVRRLRAAHVDSGIDRKKLIGLSGRVLVEVARDTTGKVRVGLGASVEDLMARTEDELPLRPGAAVLIYAAESDDKVMVTRAPDADGAGATGKGLLVDGGDR